MAAWDNFGYTWIRIKEQGQKVMYRALLIAVVFIAIAFGFAAGLGASASFYSGQYAKACNTDKYFMVNEVRYDCKRYQL